MQGLFNIPDTQEEIKDLINTIVQRNTSHPTVEKIDFMYTIVLLEAFYNNEIDKLKEVA